MRRMLRLSEAEEASVKEFQKMHGEAKERGFGRVFRSPMLFEDMVKCILLCNCQLSLSLSLPTHTHIMVSKNTRLLTHCILSENTGYTSNFNVQISGALLYFSLKGNFVCMKEL